MSRPRQIFIGTPTVVRLKDFKNNITGAILTGVVGGTATLYKEGVSVNVQTFVEDVAVNGTYIATFPVSVLSAADEGKEARIEINITGGTNLELKLSIRCRLLLKKDDGL